MKYLTGILASAMIICGTVGAVTVQRSLIPALTAIGLYAVEEIKLSAVSLDWKASPTPDPKWSITEGFFLGLQLNSDNTGHQCYVSLQTLKGDVKKLPEYLQAIAGDSTQTNSGNTIIDALNLGSPWYQPATYFKMFKRGQELTALFFDLYE